jgi:flagellar biosynthesis chaperone FliJ
METFTETENTLKTQLEEEKQLLSETKSKLESLEEKLKVLECEKGELQATIDKKIEELASAEKQNQE